MEGTNFRTSLCGIWTGIPEWYAVSVQFQEYPPQVHIIVALSENHANYCAAIETAHALNIDPSRIPVRFSSTKFFVCDPVDYFDRRVELAKQGVSADAAQAITNESVRKELLN